MRIVVTGGAGFVGSTLAILFRRDHPRAEVVAADNLKRRGSELALARLAEAGVGFAHADIRVADDIDALGGFDLLVECSAEPSVHAGYDGSPRYLIDTNLAGTINCLEAARRHKATLVFLSSSRVYPIAALRALPLERRGSRLALPADAAGPGWSAAGIAEDFPLAGHRSLYGATKFAAELFVEEYRAAYGLDAIVNRCGVLAGPWQMGKVDQGFVSLWAARHLHGGRLTYMGFGGEGAQVRDVLHAADLYDLIRRQLDLLSVAGAGVWNVGGGPDLSLSLRELTALCAERAGRSLAIAGEPETRPADIPWFIPDSARARTAFGWEPRHDVAALLDDVFAWLRAEGDRLRPVLG
jgi:CDP-paratose 2-epimerase